MDQSRGRAIAGEGAVISAIGFDADDTLWRHADFYVRAEERLAALLANHAGRADILLRLREIEGRNLPLTASA